MAPPKAKLHKATGKSKLTPQKLVSPQNSSTTQQTRDPTPSSSSISTTTLLTSEQEEQFQSELYWCIKQLESALSTGKLNNKQVQEHTKALNTLMNNGAPLIKKRQVMRLSFGDYRAKMLEDEKKIKRVSIKVSAGGQSDKSQFLRKALSSSSGSNFKFGFPAPNLDAEEQIMDNRSLMASDKEINCCGGTTASTTNNVIFIKSDNTFRFNFPNEEVEITDK